MTLGIYISRCQLQLVRHGGDGPADRMHTRWGTQDSDFLSETYGPQHSRNGLHMPTARSTVQDAIYIFLLSGTLKHRGERRLQAGWRRTPRRNSDRVQCTMRIRKYSLEEDPSLLDVPSMMRSLLRPQGCVIATTRGFRCCDHRRARARERPRDQVVVPFRKETDPVLSALDFLHAVGIKRRYRHAVPRSERNAPHSWSICRLARGRLVGEYGFESREEVLAPAQADLGVPGTWFAAD